MQPTNRVIHVAPEVEQALRRGDPVVALESTLVAHGLPRPQNLEVARELEAIVREEGAVPATIGVVEGVATVGLEPEELDRIARPEVPKLGVRDLAAAIALGTDGATTVASTAWLAAKAGIRLFATGGLGGVHRDARESWDESNDLVTLAETPVAVVSSGVKSILDVAATLERLETLGVLVVGWRTRRFPGFYLTDSGQSLDWSVESEDQAAALLAAHFELARESGIVIANPIPPEQQLDPLLHDRVLAEALKELEERGIRGKGVTPFLLERFHEETGGESLRVNREIVLRNARLAARIAVAWAGRPLRPSRP
ncbi:MAG: pseudouridine-5'-phosphate glycosidase [Bacillota bacterium]|nr:pseudouridine-5'-phosphate glycosidase [Bacillota bacterium]